LLDTPAAAEHSEGHALVADIECEALPLRSIQWHVALAESLRRSAPSAAACRPPPSRRRGAHGAWSHAAVAVVVRSRAARALGSRASGTGATRRERHGRALDCTPGVRERI